MPPAASAPSPQAGLRWVSDELRALDDAPSDLLVLTAFADERPLEGLAGLVDWRLCGALSAWRAGGFSTGELGERILYPTSHRLSHTRLLFLGLGGRTEYRSDRAIAVVDEVLEVTMNLGVCTLTTGLFQLEGLPTPLERTGPKLIERLRAAPHLTEVQIAASEASTRLIRDAMQFFGR